VEVLVGAYKADSQAGRSYLVYGPIDEDVELAADARATFKGTSGERAGFDVDGAGDVDGDGYRDLLFGAPNNDDNFKDSGATYILFGMSGM
jgi:hypothetical protein